MIQFNALEKKYADFTALHPLTFEVKQGEVFGFLGPNGAGKTTTIRMLMGLLVPSGGEVFVDGLHCQKDHIAVKRKIGYLCDEPHYFPILKHVSF